MKYVSALFFFLGPPTNQLLIVLAITDAFYLVWENIGFVVCMLDKYQSSLAARNFDIRSIPILIWIPVLFNRISV